MQRGAVVAIKYEEGVVFGCDSKMDLSGDNVENSVPDPNNYPLKTEKIGDGFAMSCIVQMHGSLRPEKDNIIQFTATHDLVNIVSAHVQNILYLHPLRLPYVKEVAMLISLQCKDLKIEGTFIVGGWNDKHQGEIYLVRAEDIFQVEEGYALAGSGSPFMMNFLQEKTQEGKITANGVGVNLETATAIAEQAIRLACESDSYTAFPFRARVARRVRSISHTP